MSLTRLVASVRSCRERMYGAVLAKPMVIPPRPAVVSFTFDEAPRGARAQGASTLERHGVRGTFYASTDRVIRIAGHTQEAETLLDLHARGHEIGCGTGDDAENGPKALPTFVDELERSARVLRSLVPDLSLRQFAYPECALTPASRDSVASHFETGRSSRPGINCGLVDCAAILANKLYGPDKVYQQALSLIHQVVRDGGWLVFFTHDVSDQPGPTGTHGIAFEHIVRASLDAGCLIKPVGEALAMLSGGEHGCEARPTVH